jgi:RNA polymerase sigma-70 factor, ECF subfamily
MKGMESMADPADEIERAAFERLWDENHPRVLAYARRRLPEAEADDVAADTFLVAWRRRAQMPAGEEAVPWLYGVARRVAADKRRSGARRERLIDALSGDPAPEAAESADTGLLEALAELGEKDREALLLVAWEGLDSTQAARAMSVSEVAFRVRLHRARRRLAALMEARRAHEARLQVPPGLEGENP